MKKMSVNDQQKLDQQTLTLFVSGKDNVQQQTLDERQTPRPAAPPKKTKILELIQTLKKMHQEIREKERTTNRTKADVDLLNELNKELENFIEQNLTA